MKFSGKLWSYHGTTLLHFYVNSEKPRDAAMRNTGTGCVVLSHHILLYHSLSLLIGSSYLTAWVYNKRLLLYIFKKRIKTHVF